MLRSIRLKEFAVDYANLRDEQTGELKPLTYSFLLRTVLLTPRREGLALASLRLHSQILDALDTTEKSGAQILLLSEELHSHLSRAVETHVWPTYMNGIIQFSDDILAAEKVDPNGIRS